MSTKLIHSTRPKLELESEAMNIPSSSPIKSNVVSAGSQAASKAQLKEMLKDLSPDELNDIQKDVFQKSAEPREPFIDRNSAVSMAISSTGGALAGAAAGLVMSASPELALIMGGGAALVVGFNGGALGAAVGQNVPYSLIKNHDQLSGLLSPITAVTGGGVGAIGGFVGVGALALTIARSGILPGTPIGAAAGAIAGAGFGLAAAKLR